MLRRLLARLSGCRVPGGISLGGGGGGLGRWLGSAKGGWREEGLWLRRECCYCSLVDGNPEGIPSDPEVQSELSLTISDLDL